MDKEDEKQEQVAKAETVDGAPLGDDARIPEGVRPTGFDKYIGQSHAVEIVKLRISAALRRREPLGHMLFTGPHGLGKTTLAGIIAEVIKEKFGGDFISISGKEITTKAQIHEVFLDLKRMSVIFCDEIHGLAPGLQDLLHKPLEEFKLDIIINRIIRTEILVPFTFIGATTNENKITAPLLSRLYELHFDMYTEEELSTIIRNSAQILNIPIDDEGALEIARRSQDTPRTANLLLLWARDFAEERAQGQVTLEVARAACDMLRIDKIGINEMGKRYMRILLNKPKGRPVGVNNLAASLSTNKGVLEERIEPFLKRRGLIEVIHGGRIATDAAYEYFGAEVLPHQTGNISALVRANKIQTSQHLSLTEFGRLLLKTEVLDPVYTMLHRANLSTDTLHRFLLGYWFFYHVGVAAQLSEYKTGQFFEKAIVLARNGRTPRGAERRHFRGEDCLKSLDYFYTTYGDPNLAVSDLIQNCAGKNVTDVLKFVKQWPEFGPWIGFKIADMLERVAGVPISFRKEDLKLYKAPAEGATLWCANEGLNYQELGISGVVTILEKQFADFKAPPRYDRPVGVPEIETILCKWKSHLNGHYPVGKDSKEILKHLHGWGDLASSLEKYVPAGTETGEENQKQKAAHGK